MKRFLLLGVLVACSGGGKGPACPDGGTCQSSPEAPKILSISTNTQAVDERGTLKITAVVTDPNGVDDLIGGQLVNPDTNGAYGAFATSAAEGAYELELPWHDINVVEPIDAPVGGGMRSFVARFYDVAGHTAEDTVTITLRCSLDTDAVCDGACTDLQTDPKNCGMCGNKISDGAECVDGHAGCVLGPENTPEACSDGCSNDGDAYIDCNDFDCCQAVTCAKGTTCNP